jgi:hypothetical protein
VASGAPGREGAAATSGGDAEAAPPGPESAGAPPARAGGGGDEEEDEDEDEEADAASATADGDATAAVPLPPPRQPINAASNPLARAYAAVLAEQLARPAPQRRYVVCRPVSGLGNKVRALYVCLAVALQQRRALLVDDDFIAPLYPQVFPSPASPWLLSQVPVVQAAVAAHEAADRTTPGSGGGGGGAAAPTAAPAPAALSIAHFYHRNKDRSRLWACWEETAQLAGCGDADAADVVIIETNQGARRAQQAALLPALQALARDPTGGGGGSRGASIPPQLLKRWLFWALFPRPGRSVGRAVAHAKAAWRWGAPTAAAPPPPSQTAAAPVAYPLVVGLHIRLFTDARRWHTQWNKIAPGYWTCVEKRVREAQAAAGVPPNRTLLFIAAAKPQARSWAARKLRHVAGSARWYNPAATFVNSRDSRSARALRTIVADWSLLSDAHLIIGTTRSSFAPAAGTRSGSTVVVASLAGDKCRVTQHELRPRTPRAVPARS